MSKNTNRSLGEGKITKMVKKYAYIMDEHLGAVHFPLVAAQYVVPNCMDLRERFQTDEHVIFTANKQINQNECKYSAAAVIKPKELVSCTGRITEIVPNRFCYAECRKIGKIFVPFSARLNMSGRHWLGKGAERNKEVSLKIFPQPQINGCNHVAYSISFPNTEGAIEATRVGNVDSVFDQIGIIVECPQIGDIKVFSHVSGFARLPASLRKSWMTKGRQIRYDAVKQNCTTQDKIHWVIRKCSDLGLLFKIVYENSMKPEQLTLEVCAIINRIAPNPPNRCAWFWNDFIGRIYCYPQNYVTGMNVMECVKCKVVYTGAFEDVPWSAYDIELLGDEEDVRLYNAQMLVTRDDWTVTYADKQKISFIGFLESPSMNPGQCFLAWTDLADSDAPPTVGQKCRATVYYQIRKDKQQWRAVLITPLNPNGIPTSNHPIYSGTRELIWPDPIEPPVLESSSSTSVSSPGPFGIPPGFEAPHIPPPIGAGMRSYNQMVKMNGVLSMPESNGHSNGSSHLPIGVNSFVLDGLRGTPMDEILPSLESLSFNHLHSSDSPRSSPMERNGSTLNGDTSFLHMFSNGSWAKNGPPQSDVFKAFQPNGETKDCETQTDTIIEHEVLRDILKNVDCLKTILQNFPNHTEKIMSMSAIWR